MKIFVVSLIAQVFSQTRYACSELCITKKAKNGRRCIPKSRTVRRGVISLEVMGNVRELLEEIEVRRERKFGAEVARDELLGGQNIDECEAIDCGSVTIEDPSSAEYNETLPLLESCFKQAKPYKITFRKQCELLNGSYY